MKVSVLPVGPVQANCYVLSVPGRDDCVLIDPGAEPERVRSACGGLRVAAILLTHGHFDHTGAVDALMEPDTRLLMHPEDIPMLTDPRLNASWMIGQRLIVRAQAEPVEEGETLAAAGITFRVHHTPGHTPGCVCYETEDCLFTGDTVMAAGVGRTDLPGGSWDQLAESLHKIRPLLRTHRLMGGHGAPETEAM